MRQLQYFTGANDNSPNWRTTATAFSPAPDTTANIPVKQQDFSLEQILWLIPMTAFVAGIVAWWIQLPSAVLMLPSVGIGLALFLTAVLARESYEAQNLSILATVGAFATSIFAAASQSGILLYTTDISVLVSILSIGLAWTFKSRPALMLSGFAGLLWLASLNPDISTSLGLGTPTAQSWLSLFPVIILAQGLLATHLRSYSTLIVTIIASYAFIASVGASLPLMALVGLFFAIAAAHHRLGKAWADQDIFGSHLHSIMGWVAAVGAAFYLQSVWLNLETGQAEALWTPLQGWWIALGLATLALFISSIIRYKHAQITLFGIFLVSAAALILPIASVRPDVIYFTFDTVPGLPAHPGFGYVIGATIMASGVAWLVNGLRRARTVDMVLGAAVVGIQGLILFNPDWINLDLGIVFALSLICALSVSGLIAGATLNHSRPAQRRA